MALEGIDQVNSGLAEVLQTSSFSVGRGRRKVEVSCEYVRDLREEDLIACSVSEMGVKAIPIKSLRQSHHTLARILAQGLPQEEVAVITGYCVARISILKSDPTFAELLAYYQGMEQSGYATARADMHDRLAQLGFDAVEILHDKLRDEGESFDASTLLKIVEVTSDRTGYGKTSTVNTNVNHSLSEDTLAKIRGAVDSRSYAAPDREALLSIALAQTAEFYPAGEAPCGGESEGSGLREEGDEGTPVDELGPATPLSQVD